MLVLNSGVLDDRPGSFGGLEMADGSLNGELGCRDLLEWRSITFSLV